VPGPVPSRSSRKTAAGEPLVQPNAENRYRVTPADLPLSCPMPGMYLWNSHPKVYLPVEAEGRARCPYCGALYELVDGDAR
jgi:uncharacterized Zn-finger protein